jgi:hypothetical protein
MAKSCTATETSVPPAFRSGRGRGGGGAWPDRDGGSAAVTMANRRAGLSERLCLIGQYSAARGGGGDPLNISGIVPSGREGDSLCTCVCFGFLLVYVCECVWVLLFVCLIYLNEKTAAVHHISRAVGAKFSRKGKGGFSSELTQQSVLEKGKENTNEFLNVVPFRQFCLVKCKYLLSSLQDTTSLIFAEFFVLQKLRE